METVINTTELLEAILLSLDKKTLLHAQRVSRRFEAAISNFIKLQQDLLVKPDPYETPGEDKQALLKTIHEEFKGRLGFQALYAFSHYEDKHNVVTFSSEDMQDQADHGAGSWRSVIVAPPHDPLTDFEMSPFYYKQQYPFQAEYDDAPTLGKIMDEALAEYAWVLR